MRERTILRMPSDGNCLFHALGHPNMSHTAVRRAVVMHLRVNWDVYKPFVDDEAYLERMARNGEWGDELALRAYHHYSGRPIRVVDAHTGTCLAIYNESATSNSWKQSIITVVLN